MKDLTCERDRAPWACYRESDPSNTHQDGIGEAHDVTGRGRKAWVVHQESGLSTRLERGAAAGLAGRKGTDSASLSAKVG